MTQLILDHFFSLDEFSHLTLFQNCETPWKALEKLEAYLLSLSGSYSDATISNKAYLVNPEKITIEAGTIVEPGAYIEGPCWIGKNCTIRHGAYIRGNVLTGDRCVIGHASELKNTIFLNDAKAAHFAYVGDSILGNKVNLGAGTRLANLRLDGKEIFIKDGEKKIATGRRKLGAILGDKSQTGCNSVCNPGTLTFPGTLILPCSCRGGLIGNFSGVKS